MSLRRQCLGCILIASGLLSIFGVTATLLPKSSAYSRFQMGGVSMPSSRRWSGSSRMCMIQPRCAYRGQVAAQLGGGPVADTFFGGFHNFLAIYNVVLTVRILLSWFPQIARQPAFEPLFVVTNPFFNIFRGLIPPIGGLDLSPLPAFFLLSFLTNATDSLGAEMPKKLTEAQQKRASMTHATPPKRRATVPSKRLGAAFAQAHFQTQFFSRLPPQPSPLMARRQ